MFASFQSDRILIYTFVFLLLSLGVACSGEPMGQGNGTTSSSSGGAVQLQGSGSTFVKPIMDKWTSEYGKINPGVRIDYQGTGSGAGIKAIQNRTADFGASDAAMNNDELKQSPDIIHVPVVLGAVVLTYNLKDVKEPLKLAPDVISDIYLGKIKKWNDGRIKRDNPNAPLPDTDITPVFRSDGSGTSDVFTDYLQKPVRNGNRQSAEPKTRSCQPESASAPRATKA
jgi:phosphate transport system substrate-binding protein